MIMKEYLFLHQLTVLHLTMIIICIIHHYIQFVLVINILLKAFSIMTSDSGGNNISNNGDNLSIIICYI